MAHIVACVWYLIGSTDYVRSDGIVVQVTLTVIDRMPVEPVRFSKVQRTRIETSGKCDPMRILEWDTGLGREQRHRARLAHDRRGRRHGHAVPGLYVLGLLRQLRLHGARSEG